jgi:CheY-like chemotaxis protein
MIVLIADDDKDWRDAATMWVKQDKKTRHVVTKTYSAPRDMLKAFESDGESLTNTVVFLDLDFENAENGLDTLKTLKEHPKSRVRNVPVVIYSKSASESEVRQSYEFNANSYVQKGDGDNQKTTFLDTVRFWMKTAKLPK